MFCPLRFGARLECMEDYTNTNVNVKKKEQVRIRYMYSALKFKIHRLTSLLVLRRFGTALMNRRNSWSDQYQPLSHLGEPERNRFCTFCTRAAPHLSGTRLECTGGTILALLDVGSARFGMQSSDRRLYLDRSRLWSDDTCLLCTVRTCRRGQFLLLLRHIWYTWRCREQTFRQHHMFRIGWS